MPILRAFCVILSSVNRSISVVEFPLSATICRNMPKFTALCVLAEPFAPADKKHSYYNKTSVRNAVKCRVLPHFADHIFVNLLTPKMNILSKTRHLTAYLRHEK